MWHSRFMNAILENRDGRAANSPLAISPVDRREMSVSILLLSYRGDDQACG